MVVTNDGNNIIALHIGSASLIFPNAFSIGSGSGAEIATVSSLYNEYISKRIAFTSTDTSTAKSVTWTGDWNSVVLSGLSVKEIGMNSSMSGGSLFIYNQLPSTVVYDGTLELQVQTTWSFQ